MIPTNAIGAPPHDVARRGLWARLTAATLVLSALSSPFDTAHAAVIPPADAPPVTLIGDSTMAGMAWTSVPGDDPREIIGAAYRLTFDAASCRRLVDASCRGRFGEVPLSVLPLMRSTLRGRLGEAVVIMAGYDDATISDAVDQVVSEAESQGVARILWLTYRTNTDYVLPGGLAARDLYGSHNAALAAAALRHPNLRILDWDKYSANQPDWFSWDGVHLTLAGADALATFIKNGLDAQNGIGRCRASQALTGVPAGGTADQTVPQQPDSGFVPLPPTRVLDTREPTLGGASGKVGTGRIASIDLDTVLPTDAVAAALSVTVTGACYAGFLTVYPCGPRPPTSNINYEVGRTTAGVAITPFATTQAGSKRQRTVCLFASAATDVVVDVMGAFTPGGARFHPLTPMRWVDTRGAAVQLNQITGPRTGRTETQVTIAGQGGVPQSATGVWLNLTIADPVTPTVLTAYPGPCGAAPLASNVNARAQRSTAASVLVGLGGDGSICVLTYTGTSHIVVDVAGWFGPGPGGLAYQPRVQTRLLDTRLDNGHPTTADIAVHVDGVAVLNAVAVDSSALGFVAVRPCGSGQVSSLINTTPNEDNANLTAVGGDAAGNVCVRANVASHLVVDQVGAFVPAA